MLEEATRNANSEPIFKRRVFRNILVTLKIRHHLHLPLLFISDLSWLLVGATPRPLHHEYHPRVPLSSQALGQEPHGQVLLRRPQSEYSGLGAGLLRRQERSRPLLLLGEQVEELPG